MPLFDAQALLCTAVADSAVAAKAGRMNKLGVSTSGTMGGYTV